jgi:GT2 family glycosyltransferase
VVASRRPSAALALGRRHALAGKAGAVSADEAGVTAVIVNRDRAAMTAECLACLRGASPRIAIIVVDNGSGEGELAALAEACSRHGAKLLPLGSNRFFGDANNIGVEAATTPFVLLLNNDVFVAPGYLEPLLAGMREAFRPAAIGPRFVYPDGRLQEAGAYLRPDGWNIQHGKAGRPYPAIAGPGLHIVDYCSAACLLIRRDVFLRAGGFDPLFDPAYFEDADLCLRLRSQGLYTYHCGDAQVVHVENSTTRALWPEQRLNRIVGESYRSFCERWGPFLAGRLRGGALMPRFPAFEWQPEEGDGRTSVWLSAPGVPDRSPAWSRLLRLGFALDPDLRPIFVSGEPCSRCRIHHLGRALGVEAGPFAVRATAPETGGTAVTMDGPELAVTGPESERVLATARRLARTAPS